MIPQQWPDTAKYDEISRKHPDFDPVLCDLGIGRRRAHDALYEGGEKFRQCIDHFLDKRNNEGGHDNYRVATNLKSEGRATTGEEYVRSGGGDQYAKRKKISRYTPIASGKIDWMIAATHQAPPRFVATTKPKGQSTSTANKGHSILDFESSPEAAYWQDLNRNADGNGKDLSSLTREALKNVILHRYAWIHVSFPEVEVENRSEQRRLGGLDARLRVCGADVDDWGFDKDGQLEYVRTFEIKVKKSTPWSDGTEKEWIWTYHTANESIKYVANETDAGLPNDAILSDIKPHGFGRVPFFPVVVPSFMWLMERLRELILKHFNRDAALTYSLNQMGFSLFTLIGQTEKPNIYVDPETGALCLDGGSADFKSPNPQVWDALKGDLDRIEKDIDAVIQAAALSASKRDTQGRQSGVAKFREFGSLATLLSEYASALRDTLETIIDALKEFRDETDLDVQLEGLDKFDVQSLELKGKLAEQALALPTTQTFRQWVIADYQAAVAHNAPPNVRQLIHDESFQNDVVSSSASAKPTTIRSEKTQEVILDSESKMEE